MAHPGRRSMEHARGPNAAPRATVTVDAIGRKSLHLHTYALLLGALLSGSGTTPAALQTLPRQIICGHQGPSRAPRLFHALEASIDKAFRSAAVRMRPQAPDNPGNGCLGSTRREENI
jgi:hypothetical protein